MVDGWVKQMRTTESGKEREGKRVGVEGRITVERREERGERMR